jgi:TRAP-type mannitol/chloroaromatic compound transport system substrate-binding protein
MNIRRRGVLVAAAAAATSVRSFAAPAVAQQTKELKMVTDWPAHAPGPGTSADRLARSITTLSDGRFKVTVYPAGTLVRAFETLPHPPVLPTCITRRIITSTANRRR